MTVKTLIELLQNEVAEDDRENAEIEIWCDEQRYDISEMGGFSLSPDITITIKPIDSGSEIKPAIFKKSALPEKERLEKIVKECFNR